MIRRADPASLVQKVWSFAHILKDDGLAYMDYTEQITYLLFLKLAWEQRDNSNGHVIPPLHDWGSLRAITRAEALARSYQRTLKRLSEEPGLLGLIYTRPTSKINDPAKLRRLMDLIDAEQWSALDVDVKGEIYEGLLAKNAEDVRGGAGQYFTPRPVIQAIVEVMRPQPMTTIADPASGTGGFLLAAYESLRPRVRGRKELRFLQERALLGIDIVPSVARLCAMNLYLHGVGTDPSHPVVTIGDSLAARPQAVDMVLTNPPFGKKSSIKVFSDNKGTTKESIHYSRDDFWATTSNKQLNFVQHVYTMLKPGGRTAIVVPDNVLFEAGAGETIRRKLLETCDVHTLLRLPTGIWYSAGVKANVLFFDKRPPRDRRLWIYDLRTNKSFSQRQNPISRGDLQDFVTCYNANDRGERRETERFRAFRTAELLAGERGTMDILWLRDDSMTDPNTLPNPGVLAQEIVNLLNESLSEFSEVAEMLRGG